MFQAKNIVTEVLKVNTAIVIIANANMVMDLLVMDIVTDDFTEKRRKKIIWLV